jgi:transposase-like protein
MTPARRRILVDPGSREAPYSRVDDHEGCPLRLSHVPLCRWVGGIGRTAEFRRRALDLVAAGRSVREVARLLEVSDQSIYTWRRELIDRGELLGLSSEEREELTPRRRMRAGDRARRAAAGSRAVGGGISAAASRSVTTLLRC